MKRAHAIATLSLELSSAGSRVQLLPAGPRFRADDGRPKEVPAGWLINAEIAARLIRQMEARTNKTAFDFEHQTYLAKDNGKPAPASGWFSRIEWVEGEGLFAVDVEWTDKAKTMIEGREYKYVSPVFAFDKATGAVLSLGIPALTNNPALDGMTPVTALAAASFAAQLSMENTMDKELLELLCKLCGLPADANEQALMTALKKLVGKHETFAALVAERDGQIALLSSKQFDAAKYVPIETLAAANAQIAQLTQQVQGSEREALMVAATKDGRILPHMEDWAKSLTLDQLKAYLTSAKPLTALTKTQTNGNEPEDKKGDEQAQLTQEELAVCTNMGIKPEDFLKAKKATTAPA